MAAIDIRNDLVFDTVPTVAGRHNAVVEEGLLVRPGKSARTGHHVREVSMYRISAMLFQAGKAEMMPSKAFGHRCATTRASRPAVEPPAK